MAKYLLTGIDDDEWRIFKAACDIHGLTVKEVFLDYIDVRVSVFKKNQDYSKLEPFIKKHGGKKK